MSAKLPVLCCRLRTIVRALVHRPVVATAGHQDDSNRELQAQRIAVILEAAYTELNSMLKSLSERATSIRFTLRILVLLAGDIAMQKWFLTLLEKSEIQCVFFPSGNEEETSILLSLGFDNLIMDCTTAIAKTLSTTTTLRSICVRKSPIQFALPILAACRQVKQIQLHLNGVEVPKEQTAALVTSLFAHPSLEVLSICGMREDLLYAILPALASLITLSSLSLRGNSSHDPVTITTEADVDMIRRVLQMQSMESFCMGGFQFTSDQSMDIICDGIESSAVKSYEFYRDTIFPESKHAKLAQAITNSKVERLRFDAVASHTFLKAFRDSLITVDSTCRLKELYINAYAYTANVYNPWDGRKYCKVGQNWAAQVEQVLEFNRDVDTSMPDIATEDEAVDPHSNWF